MGIKLPAKLKRVPKNQRKTLPPPRLLLIRPPLMLKLLEIRLPIPPKHLEKRLMPLPNLLKRKPKVPRRKLKVPKIKLLMSNLEPHQKNEEIIESEIKNTFDYSI